VTEDNREASTMRGPWPTGGSQAVAKIIVLIVKRPAGFSKYFLTNLRIRMEFSLTNL
jgi:hypothetical protein